MKFRQYLNKYRQSIVFPIKIGTENRQRLRLRIRQRFSNTLMFIFEQIGMRNSLLQPVQQQHMSSLLVCSFIGLVFNNLLNAGAIEVCPYK